MGERQQRPVSLCDRVREVCPGGGLPEFRAVAADLNARIGFLLAQISDDVIQSAQAGSR